MRIRLAMIENSSRPITEEDLTRMNRGVSPVAPTWTRLAFAAFTLPIVAGAIGAGLGMAHLRGGAPALWSHLLGFGALACGAFALAMLYVAYHVVFPRAPAGGRLIEITKGTRVVVTRVPIERAFLTGEEDDTPGLLVLSSCGRWIRARGAELSNAIRPSSNGVSEVIGASLTLETVGGYLVKGASDGAEVPLEVLHTRLGASECVAIASSRFTRQNPPP